MSDQEKQDLVVLNAECNSIRLMAFSAMNNSLRMSVNELKASGFATVEIAAVAHFQYAQKKINALTKAFEEKYLDW